jgi:biotin carboxyl carrier protein
MSGRLQIKVKLKALLENNQHDVSLNLASSSAVAEIDGRRYELELRELSDGVYLLIDGTKVYRCRVDTKRDQHAAFEVALRGRLRHVKIIDPKRLRSAQSSGAHSHGAAEILSPMPGKVVRILVEVGAHVESGAGVIVVEAMKMQNEIKSPKKGVVQKLNAAVGASVNAGEVLAIVE